jgi:8-oxo-dGTP pyrophosphatase MutT (NUDIX family)
MQAWQVWLNAALAQVQVPPRRPRVPLLASGEVIGTVEPDFLLPFASNRNSIGDCLLHKEEHSALGAVWTLQGDANAGLAQLAEVLRQKGLAGAWRNEQLRVCNAQGLALATVERAVMRPLGIATQAVHLVGFAPDGRIWVQQRALDKANDPGLWDTLMGGMVSAADSVADALARETWEEAGLRMGQLLDLRHRGCIDFARPAHDGGGAGYLVERIDWYTATVPSNVTPVNQDGEVAQFACLSEGDVQLLMGQGLMTLEAGLILAAAIGASGTRVET